MQSYLVPKEGSLRLCTDPSTRNNAKVHPIVQYCRDLVECFNHWHNLAIANGTPGGLGGLMSVRLVQMFLKDAGRAAVGLQVQQQLRQSTPSAKTLTDDEVDKLNRTRARQWCAHLGLTIRGTNEELKKRLREHFKLTK